MGNRRIGDKRPLTGKANRTYAVRFIPETVSFFLGDQIMQKKKKALNTASVRWALRITVFSGVISVILTLAATRSMQSVSFVPAVAILMAFVLIGVTFDMFGIAAASASETPFHAMASRRVSGASESLYFVRNADKVCSICSDVVGDACGIVSGAGSAVIVALAVMDFGLGDTFTALAASGLLVGLTVGGKALAKPVAMRHSTKILMFAGRTVYAFKRAVGKV